MSTTGEVGAMIEEYLDALPAHRRSMMRALRLAIVESLPRGYVERFEGRLFSYEIPLTRYPRTYNGRPLMLAALASQKSYVSLYLMAVYGDKATEAWFKDVYAGSGKKLSMGKSCVHFKTAEDLPLEVVRQAIAKVSVAEYIKIYESGRRRARKP